jgi:hypothetical protein
MIIFMGGRISSRVSIATHVLIDQSDYTYVRRNIAREVTKASIVNLKYILHTYFYFNKMDVTDEEYKIIPLIK